MLRPLTKQGTAALPWEEVGKTTHAAVLWDEQIVPVVPAWHFHNLGGDNTKDNVGGSKVCKDMSPTAVTSHLTCNANSIHLIAPLRHISALDFLISGSLVFACPPLVATMSVPASLSDVGALIIVGFSEWEGSMCLVFMRSDFQIWENSNWPGFCFYMKVSPSLWQSNQFVANFQFQSS